jgi:uncharacterized membrane protein
VSLSRRCANEAGDQRFRPTTKRTPSSQCHLGDHDEAHITQEDVSMRGPASRSESASYRATLSLILGVTVGSIAAAFLPWQLAELAAFDAAALLQLLWVWSIIGRLDSHQTSLVATREDNSRRAASAFVNVASVVSLIGVALALVKARQTGAGMEVALTAASILTVAAAWATVHTVFILRYAHLYYEGVDGGLNFGETAPDYRDFAYVAFTIGMTYQVSDTEITHPTIRRTVTHHALISYIFGTVIIGLTINVMAGFIR